MNFFASSAYLAVVAEVYFAGRPTRVADVRLGEDVLRVLVVDGRQVVCEVPFLDYHLPLRPEECGSVERRRAYASRVARGVVSSEERQSIPKGLIASPYVDWSGFSSYDDYLAHRDELHHDTVKKHRRLRQRLAEDFGPLEFTVDDRRDDVLELALKWKSAQFVATGESDVFADPRNVRFFEELRARDLLVSSTLRASGRLLSVWLGFVHERVWSGWIFAYDHDPALRPYSAGHHLMQSMLAYSFASGHREFDHSVGGQDWKWQYATHARLIGPLGTPPQSPYRAARTATRVALERLGLDRTHRTALRAWVKHTGTLLEWGMLGSSLPSHEKHRVYSGLLDEAGLFHPSYEGWREKRFAKILEIYGRDFFAGKKVLELGAGHGDLGASLANLGAEVLCLEGRAENVSFARVKHRKVARLRFEQFNLENDFSRFGRFDLILNFGLLYHLKNVDAHLRCCFSMSNDMLVETVVCDSIDPYAIFFRPERSEVDEEALEGIGSRPSPFYIERLATENSCAITRCFTSDLNYTHQFRYDWEHRNDGRLSDDFVLRRFWRFTRSAPSRAGDP